MSTMNYKKWARKNYLMPKFLTPGQSYKSHKMWSKLGSSGGKAFLTVLTREFLFEDLKTVQGHKRIDDNAVNVCRSIIDQYNLKYLQVNGNTYNVPFYNEKQEGLHNQKKLTVVKLRGKLQIFCQWILNVFQWWDLLMFGRNLKDITHCHIICVNKWPKIALTCLCVDAPLSTILIVDLFLFNHPSDHPWWDHINWLNKAVSIGTQFTTKWS